MPKFIGSFERGKVDLLSMFGVGFLVIALITIVTVTSNPLKTQLVNPLAAILPNRLEQKDGGVTQTVNKVNQKIPAKDKNDEASPVIQTGTQTGITAQTSGYDKDVVINTIADLNKPGYDCSKGGCAPGVDVAGYYFSNGKYYAVGGTGNDPATYTATSLATQKAEAPASNQTLNQVTGGVSPFTGTTATTNIVNPPTVSTHTETFQSLEKTDEGFITTTTTITRDATGAIVDTKSVSTTAKTTSTFTQTATGLVRTDKTVTTDLATGKVVSTTQSQTTLANTASLPTGSININQQGSVSIRQPVGGSCTYSSDCDSGSCSTGGSSGGFSKTCQPATGSQSTYNIFTQLFSSNIDQNKYPSKAACEADLRSKGVTPGGTSGGYAQCNVYVNKEEQQKAAETALIAGGAGLLAGTVGIPVAIAAEAAGVPITAYLAAQT